LLSFVIYRCFFPAHLQALVVPPRAPRPPIPFFWVFSSLLSFAGSSPILRASRCKHFPPPLFLCQPCRAPDVCKWCLLCHIFPGISPSPAVWFCSIQPTTPYVSFFFGFSIRGSPSHFDPVGCSLFLLLPRVPSPLVLPPMRPFCVCFCGVSCCLKCCVHPVYHLIMA